ncbi:MAG TPA: hypothetical protein VIM19_05720 [Actinomycetes bacterium]
MAALSVVVAALVVGLGAPAIAATSEPTYPPGGGGGGGGGNGPVIQIDRTLAVVGQPAYVFIYNCGLPATLTVTGPGRSPGVPTRSVTITTAPDPNKITHQVIFDRVGRNTVAVTCGTGSASLQVTVKAATVAPTTPSGVLGESVQSGTGVAAAVGTLVKTGADAAGPLLIALPLLILGLLMVVLSRPRRRRRRHAN